MVANLQNFSQSLNDENMEGYVADDLITIFLDHGDGVLQWRIAKHVDSKTDLLAVQLSLKEQFSFFSIRYDDEDDSYPGHSAWCSYLAPTEATWRLTTKGSMSNER